MGEAQAVIVDLVMYSGETEALDIRLHELADVVDLFVVVESTETFTGIAKTLYLGRELAANRFGEHQARILYYVATLPDGGPWEREAYQRNVGARLLDAMPDDTVVLVGDVDEIPRADAVQGAARLLGGDLPQLAFDQDLCLYYVNNVCYSSRWRGTQAVTLAYLRKVTPQGVRDQRNTAPALLNAGWHFGSLLAAEGAARFARKLAGFSHADECKPFATEDNIAAAIEAGADVSHRTDILFKADLEPKEEGYPAWLWQHRHDYPALWYPGSKL